jgi:hypothetical protein
MHRVSLAALASLASIASLACASCSHKGATPGATAALPAGGAMLEPEKGPPRGLPNPMFVADSTHGGGFESCYRTFRPSGDVRRDLEQMTGMCGPPNAMHAVTPVLEGGQSSADPIARFTFKGETGRCYRVFSASDGNVADLDMAVLDPDQAVVGHDTNADAFPILNPDGPLCLTKPGTYTVLVSVEKGAGKYALQVWGF